MNEALYPWLHATWQRLQAQRRAGRLGHALLLHGPGGLGKARLARAFAESLLCETPDADGFACGRCTACQLLAAGTHPDLLQVGPPEGKSVIAIDSIRELSARLAMTSHAGGYQACLLQPAEAMNSAAANSLLKTLEEPTDNTVLLLITEQPARLPATIRSRCQMLRLSPPDSSEAVAWLQAQCPEEAADRLLELADGAPLKALQLAEAGVLEDREQWLQQLSGIRAGQLDPLQVAADWAQDETLRPLHWFGRWLMDMIRLRSGAAWRLGNEDQRGLLEGLARDLEPRQLFALLDQAWEALRLLPTSVNRQLLMEDLLIRWARTARNRP
ncbi:DNA polymerase III subunit delta' [Thiohalobacter sp. IOR34]|uniref:DNA polymerase III subunit delta' n=1 Tax=Thiohalobacter sp. IOR34 TaxID=3057176 RepID=UPI0025AFDE7D|nr:DNA polymerase III subunit delta' [Thiohalobacter sp. IOR34]WJW74259.1 DNA polymerase III subunit delta' [Thiohalobacter sp. IOR34]